MAQFRAKARAVELLGKGQIADLPTAISELWKNGYDAYGDNLEAFLYLNGYNGSDQPYFVISDDGKGMTRDDILNKWLFGQVYEFVYPKFFGYDIGVEHGKPFYVVLFA